MNSLMYSYRFLADTATWQSRFLLAMLLSFVAAILVAGIVAFVMILFNINRSKRDPHAANKLTQRTIAYDGDLTANQIIDEEINARNNEAIENALADAVVAAMGEDILGDDVSGEKPKKGSGNKKSDTKEVRSDKADTKEVGADKSDTKEVKAAKGDTKEAKALKSDAEETDIKESDPE